MDASDYKSFRTSRGINYSYFFTSTGEAKLNLIFLHGFPSSSLDWEHQVTYFRAKGFGIVVPDVLGYGGTDKPHDPAQYRMSLMAQDIVDILDHEKLQNVVAIGHDWGAALTSRLATYHSPRFKGFAFFAAGYMPPAPGFDLDMVTRMYKAKLGSEVLGYWAFFNDDDSERVIAEHFDSFFSILFTDNPMLWLSHIAPTGALRAWLESDKMTPLAPYATESFVKSRKELLLKDGVAGALCWYKAMVRKHTPGEEGEKGLDPEATFDVPAFFGAALKDMFAHASPSKAAVAKHFKNHTIVDFDTDHWIQLAQPDKVNEELSKWIQGLAL